MAYKSILTILTDPKEVAPVLGAAVPFAESQGAHLEVLCLGIDRTQTGYYFAGATALMHDETIMQAQTDIREWYYTVPDAERTPATLRAKALESMGRALDAIGVHGTPEDRLHYVEFVVALANRVAKAAREGDVLGVGGELVSKDEREFIDRLQSLAQVQPG
jgi:hypothetical protein